MSTVDETVRGDANQRSPRTRPNTSILREHAMQITCPAGRALTVGELREALATCPDSAPVNVLFSDEVGGYAAPVVRVATTGFLLDIVVDAVDPSGLLGFVEEIVAGEYTLKQAKAEAILVLRAAGFEVSA